MTKEKMNLNQDSDDLDLMYKSTLNKAQEIRNCFIKNSMCNIFRSFSIKKTCGMRGSKNEIKSIQ